MSYIDVKLQEVTVADDADQGENRQKRQRLRSLAIALGLAFLVLLFYAATIVRLGGNH